MAGKVSKPTYKEEKQVLAMGFNYIAGIDEVGRGALAGPVVAAAVILPPNPAFRWLSSINDSKVLSPEKRVQCARLIKKNALATAVGVIGEEIIDRINILQATKLAMRQAVEGLSVKPDYLLIDAVKLAEIKTPQKSIIFGDKLSVSIACASIVAKVARDEMMNELDARYPQYGFARHKGYGTAEHIRCLRKFGCCDIHRKTFAPVKDVLVSNE